MATRTALSSYEMYWYPWDDTKENIWIRPMPDKPYVIHLNNNPFYYYKYRMHQESLAKQFGRWYKEIHGGGKTICLLGIRASESIRRYSAFLNKNMVITVPVGSLKCLRTSGTLRHCTIGA